MKRMPTKDPSGLRQTIAKQIFEEFNLLLDLETASAVDDVDKFRWEYLRKEVFSKYVGPDTDSAELRRSRAIEKWLAVEQRNKRTNIRLYSEDTVFQWRTPEGKLWFMESEDVLELARQIVHRVIGDDPPTEAEGNFSGGASTSLTNSLGNVARKFMVKAHVTHAAWTYILPQILRASTWMRMNPEAVRPVFVQGNELFTVPKTTVIDRVAAKEPDYNMWAQKRLGDGIRQALKRFGINLNDQTQNQRLAKSGSLRGDLCTMDLSSASDSMSHALVSRLLPPGWFVELNALRSEYTCIDGVWHENQMFSSMGNGFTFELESLLFYALARAVCILTKVRGRVSVYGDDIIVPSNVFNLLKQVLGFAGFIVNPKKSHYGETDLFRESCGAHWYAGYDVKPFYIKSPLREQPDLIHFLNSFRRWLDVEPFCHTVSELTRDMWWEWAKNVDRRAYGGRDLSSKGALCTPHAPRMEWRQLVADRSKLQLELQDGLYLQSLRTMYTSDDTSPSPTSPLEWGPPSTPAKLSETMLTWKLRKRRPSYWDKVLNPIPVW